MLKMPASLASFTWMSPAVADSCIAQSACIDTPVAPIVNSLWGTQPVAVNQPSKPTVLPEAPVLAAAENQPTPAAKPVPVEPPTQPSTGGPLDLFQDKQALTKAKEALEQVGLLKRQEHFPHQLSGGECQRVAVVRALINRPKLLLADEPTGALDRATADALASLLLDLNREQATALIVVTHAPDLARKMGRVLELRDGVLTQIPP